MSKSAAESELCCPHCGADVMPEWTSCWLCGQPLTSGAAKPRGTQPPPRVAESVESSASKLLGNVVMGLVGVLLLCMVLGIATTEGVDSAVGFVVFLVPAFIITATKALRRRGTPSAMSALQITTSFIVWAIGIWLLLIGVVVAAFAALFVICLASGGFGNFH